MFYWTERSGGNMSKAEILRGVVAEKLSAAAREIFAVVERTVSGYEEEIERQRRQLERLLQPRVALERKELIPESEDHEVVVVGEEEEEEQQTGVEDSGSLGLLWFDDEDENDEDEERNPSNSRQKKEDLKDPDYQITPRGRSGRSVLSDFQPHVDLKVRILEDPHTNVLSKTVFQSCPVQQLRVPRGLSHGDFLSFLASSFPRLGRRRGFDLLTSDRSRRLRPLGGAALTPEEAFRAAGSSSLYIRPKDGDDSPSVSMATTDQTTPGLPSPGSPSPGSPSPRLPSPRRRRGRPRLGEEPSLHRLRVCLLQGRSDQLPRDVSQRCAVQELLCPRGLQQEDFLSLLRSAFPPLQPPATFDLCRADRSRRLRPLRLDAAAPEQILQKSLLYIRPKTGGEEEEEEDGKSHFLHENNNSTEEMTENEAELKSSLPADEEWKPSCDPELQPTKKLNQQKKQKKLKKSPGGGKKSCRVCGVWYRILGSLVKHSWSHVEEAPPTCGVCGSHFEAREGLKSHLRAHKKTHECSYCGKSFLTVSGLSSHTTNHTGLRPFKCDSCGKTFAHGSSLSVHRWVHVAEKPHKCDACPRAFGLKAQLRAHAKIHAGGKEKYPCAACGKAFSDLRSLTRHKATHSAERRHECGVCGKRFKLPGTLKSHEKTHAAGRERPFLCHVCCKSFLSGCSLTAHVKTHSGEKPFSCEVCGKAFVSNGELKSHSRVHSGEAPFGCSDCGRFFKRKTHLSNHVRTHLGMRQFSCGVCGKAFSRQEHLTVHMRTHSGERPYKCSECDKAFTQSHCLKTHMKSHRALNAPPTSNAASNAS